jgi:cellulose biosynthesis protein BcsQ
LESPQYRATWPFRLPLPFRAARETGDIQAIQITTPTIHKDFARFDHDMKIIDAGGRDNKAFRSAIMAADLLVIPCLPSSVDIWVASDVIEILSEAGTYKEIPAHFALITGNRNRIQHNCKTGKQQSCETAKTAILKNGKENQADFLYGSGYASEVENWV